ncbi:hypothetical protein Tco_0025056 [Tanacetum coccineum]
MWWGEMAAEPRLLEVSRGDGGEGGGVDGGCWGGRGGDDDVATVEEGGWRSDVVSAGQKLAGGKFYYSGKQQGRTCDAWVMFLYKWVGVGMVSVGCHGGVVVVRGMVFVVIAAVAVGVDDEDGLDGSSGGVRWR